MRRQSGITLLEVLIAVMLLSVLSAGMMMALRLGISALSRTDKKLMENRRIAGAQRLVEQELEGLIPVSAPCIGSGNESKDPLLFFSGQANNLTMISGFSLQEAWRGRPQVLQMFTVPAEEGDGVRLVVNEIPYNGSFGAGQLCIGAAVEPETGRYPRFRPPFATATTFVLADHLSEVRFQYLAPSKKPGEPGLWMPRMESRRLARRHSHRNGARSSPPPPASSRSPSRRRSTSTASRG